MRTSHFCRNSCIASALILILVNGCVTENKQATNVEISSNNPGVVDASDQKPNATTLYAMARILATQGRDNDCQRVLLQIINQQPQFMPAYSDLAELYLRRNSPSEAIQILSEGLKLSPSDPILLNNLGLCHLLMENYSAALDQFSKASEAAPDQPAYLNNKATALGLLGRFDDAQAIYEITLPSPEDVRHNMMVLRAAYSPTP